MEIIFTRWNLITHRNFPIKIDFRWNRWFQFCRIQGHPFQDLGGQMTSAHDNSWSLLELQLDTLENYKVLPRISAATNLQNSHRYRNTKNKWWIDWLSYLSSNHVLFDLGIRVKQSERCMKASQKKKDHTTTNDSRSQADPSSTIRVE